jgi:hypothetical protein
MPKEKKYKPKAKPMPYFEPEGMEREYRAKPMPYRNQREWKRT